MLRTLGTTSIVNLNYLVKANYFESFSLALNELTGVIETAPVFCLFKESIFQVTEELAFMNRLH